MLYRTYEFTKIMLTYQILLFKSGKISLRKKIGDKRLIKISI